MNGSISRLTEGSNYGFIAGEDGKEYFFHASALTNKRFYQVQVGDAVTFEPGRSEKGLRTDVVEVD